MTALSPNPMSHFPGTASSSFELQVLKKKITKIGPETEEHVASDRLIFNRLILNVPKTLTMYCV